jgi:hypothetical protein
MDRGASILLVGLLSAVIGVTGALVTTWLRLRGRADYFDKAAMRLLKRKLAQSPEGLSGIEVDEYGKQIGLEPKETRQLLVLLHAELRQDRWWSPSRRG